VTHILAASDYSLVKELCNTRQQQLFTAAVVPNLLPVTRLSVTTLIRRLLVAFHFSFPHLGEANHTVVFVVVNCVD